jgi:hypothetical protein
MLSVSTNHFIKESSKWVLHIKRMCKYRLKTRPVSGHSPIRKIHPLRICRRCLQMSFSVIELHLLCCRGCKWQMAVSSHPGYHPASAAPSQASHFSAQPSPNSTQGYTRCESELEIGMSDYEFVAANGKLSTLCDIWRVIQAINPISH